MNEQNETHPQAEALKRVRTSARMTQAHLAAAAGVSARTIRRAEAGEPITDEVARALCAVLGLDVTRLSEVVAQPEAPERRPIPRYDLDLRAFAWVLFRWVGGIHPLALVFLMAPGLYVRFETIVYALVSVALMYVFALVNGCGPRQAFEFLRGRAFADGTPVELEDRLAEMRKRRGKSGGPAQVM